MCSNSGQSVGVTARVLHDGGASVVGGWPACVRPLGDSLIDIRDRAVLLIG